MKVLRDVDPTREQLQVILDPTPGFWLIRGAAGSGKTTTALLRLRFLTRFWRERRADLGLAAPVRILVLTFNRTLRGYISELAEQQILAGPDLELTVSTFGHWAIDLIARASCPRPHATHGCSRSDVRSASIAGFCSTRSSTRLGGSSRRT